MNKFEYLTKYLPMLEDDNIGAWAKYLHISHKTLTQEENYEITYCI